MACGHCLAAVRSGMAECTPNLRASYEAAETTPRSSRCPPTTTAFPFSDGSYNSSTDTKNASMSTWKIVRDPGGCEAAILTRFYQRVRSCLVENRGDHRHRVSRVRTYRVFVRGGEWSASQGRHLTARRPSGG